MSNGYTTSEYTEKEIIEVYTFIQYYFPEQDAKEALHIFETQ